MQKVSKEIKFCKSKPGEWCEHYYDIGHEHPKLTPGYMGHSKIQSGIMLGDENTTPYP